MTEGEIDGLAAKVASLAPEEAEAFERTVSGLRAERSRVEKARIEGLLAMTDREVVDQYLEWREPQADTLLAHLRDAGFVRVATPRQAYRAGYECYGCEHLGDGHPLQDEDAPEVISARDYDLREMTGKS